MYEGSFHVYSFKFFMRLMKFMTVLKKHVNGYVYNTEFGQGNVSKYKHFGSCIALCANTIFILTFHHLIINYTVTFRIYVMHLLIDWSCNIIVAKFIYLMMFYQFLCVHTRIK